VELGVESFEVLDLTLLLAKGLDHARPGGIDRVRVEIGDDVVVAVRRNALKRCIINLVDNAQKFSPAGTSRATPRNPTKFPTTASRSR